MRDDRAWLADILEAIENIEKHVARGRDVFSEDELVQVWVVHHIQIIGEAAARLGEETRRLIPEIPWSDVVAMRNILVHRYFGIDLDEVWSTVEKDLPVLREAVKSVLAQIGKNGSEDV